MPEDLRIQAQIELRMLRVLNFQRQLRSEVIIFYFRVLIFCRFKKSNFIYIRNVYMLQIFSLILDRL